MSTENTNENVDLEEKKELSEEQNTSDVSAEDGSANEKDNEKNLTEEEDVTSSNEDSEATSDSNNEVADMAEEKVDVSEAEKEAPDNVPKKSKKKIIIGGAIAAAAVVVAAGAFFMFGNGVGTRNGSGSGSSQKYILSARFNEDGKGYIVKEGGAVVEFDAEKDAKAYMTRDRKNIIVNDSEGVTVLNGNGEKVTQQSDSKEIFDVSTALIGDSAVVFSSASEDDVEAIKKNIISDYNKENPSSTITTSEFNTYYNKRFSNTVSDAKECYKINLDKNYDDVHPATNSVFYCDYNSATVVEISSESEVYDGVMAKNAGTVYLATEDGIYTYAAGKEEKEKIQGKKQDTLDILYVSDAGDKVVWADASGADVTVYSYTGKEVVKFASLETSEDIEVYSIAGTNNIICLGEDMEYLLYGDMSSDSPEKIQLKDNISGYYIYDANGVVENSTVTSKDGIYAFLGDDSTLYYISLSTGEREKVSSDISSIVTIESGKIVYVTEDGTLKVASINKDEMGDSEKIASDVYVSYGYSYAYASSASSVYYLKDVDGSIGTLYYWNGSDSEKVANDVCTSQFVVSDNGKCAYGTDSEDIKDTYTDYMTYYIANGAEGTKIANDIISGVFFSSDRNTNDFCLLQYDQVDKEDNIIVNILYYNGSEPSKVVSGVIY